MWFELDERLDLAFMKAANVHRVGTLNLCMLTQYFAELSYFGHYHSQKYVGAATIKMIYLQLLVSNSLITLTRDLFILLTWQGCRKQFPDGQAQLDVSGEDDNSHANRAAKFWSLLFLTVRSCSHYTSASNWESKAWKFSHTEHKSYACALTYIPCRNLLQ